MAEYKLTYYNVQGLGEPIRYIFALAGVPYEDNRIPKDDTTYPVLPAEIKDKLPWGQMPMLEFEGKRLSQSTTICRFLARKFKLAGANEYESAKCDEIVDAIKDFGREWRVIINEKDEAKKAELVKKVMEVTTPKYMGKLSSIVEQNGGKWFVGSNATWTDLLFVHYIYTLVNTHTKMDIIKDYPVLDKLVKSVFAIPQIKEWIEKRPRTE